MSGYGMGGFFLQRALSRFNPQPQPDDFGATYAQQVALARHQNAQAARQQMFNQMQQAQAAQNEALAGLGFGGVPNFGGNFGGNFGDAFGVEAEEMGWANEDNDEFGAAADSEDDQDERMGALGLKRLGRKQNRLASKEQKWQQREATARTGIGKRIASMKADGIGKRKDKVEAKIDRKTGGGASPDEVMDPAAAAGPSSAEFPFGYIREGSPPGPGRQVIVNLYPESALTGGEWEASTDSPLIKGTIASGRRTASNVTLVSKSLPYAELVVVGIRPLIAERSNGATVLAKQFMVGGDADLFLDKQYTDLEQYDPERIKGPPGLRKYPTLSETNTASIEVAIAGDNSDTISLSVGLVCEVVRDSIAPRQISNMQRFPARYAF